MFTFNVVVCMDDIGTFHTFADAFNSYKTEITNRVNSPNGLSEMELHETCWIEVVDDTKPHYPTGQPIAHPMYHEEIVNRAHQENLLKGN